MLGSLVAGGGIVWAAYIATNDFQGLDKLEMPPGGPIEVCALGILIWLHAKWRSSIAVR